MPIYPFNNDDSAKPIHGGPQFSRGECHEIFKEMVRAELRNGPLVPRRRKRLIQYAAALQLRPLEASRIISSISKATGNEPARGELLSFFVPSDDSTDTPISVPLWVKIVVPLLIAFAADRVIRGMF